MNDRPDITTGRAWAYAGVALGGLVSIAANIAHSYVPPTGNNLPAQIAALIAAGKWAPEPGAVIGAIFWPVALFVAIEVLARIPWPDGKRWTVLRYGGLVPVATVAAVVSYRHMSGLLAWYQEDPLTVAIGPLAADGLMVMCAGALIATGAWRTAQVGTEPAGESVTAAPVTAPVVAPAPETPATVTAPDKPAPVKRTPARTRKPAAKRTAAGDNAARIAALVESRPDIPQVDIAKRLKISTKTVGRYDPRKAAADTSITAANGHDPMATSGQGADNR